MIRNNLNYSIALWRWCAATRKKLIYASSAATYGDGSAGFDDAGGIDALKRLRPLNLYGWSKHAFDLWAMRQAEAGHAPPLWAGLKFFNVFGPNEHHKGEMMSLVVKNYPRVIAGETIPLFKSYRPDYADGEQLRDFVYVKDCAAALLWLWRHEPDCGNKRHLQSRHRPGAQLSRSDARARRRLRRRPEDRIRRYAGRDPPELPVFHAGEHDQAAPRRLQRPVHAARRRRARLRDAILVAARSLSVSATASPTRETLRSDAARRSPSLHESGERAGVRGSPFIKTVAAARARRHDSRTDREEDAMQGEKWVGTWAAAPAPAEGVVGFNNQTLRMNPRISLGGDRLRVRISNAYGNRPLTIGAAHIALRDKGPAIVAGLRPQAELRRRATAP